LYLNEVVGGEIEIFPRYRLYLKNKYPSLQKWLDQVWMWGVMKKLFGRKVTVKPQPGRMVLMMGNRSLHSVRPVESEQKRINIVLSFDRPDARSFNAELDTYLYTTQSISTDPNYAIRGKERP
jgi:hypothetical protein